MHFVHTRIFFVDSPLGTVTFCRLGIQRLFVRGALSAQDPEWTCLIFCPNCGPFPQTSQTLAIFIQYPPERNGATLNNTIYANFLATQVIAFWLIMNNGPITDIIKNTKFLDQEDSLSRAVSLLRAAQMPALPVTSGGRVAGLVSEERVLAHLAAGGSENVKVVDVMDRNPTCANIHMSISQAGDMMTVNHADVLPVIDEFGGFRGIVTGSDVLAAQMDVMRPPMIAGMATPIGVHLTTGAISAGPGNLGLFLTGVSMALMMVAAHVIVASLTLGIDRLFGTHLFLLATSPMTGIVTWQAMSVDWIHYVIIGLTMALMLFFLRMSTISGYHAAEHQVVHSIEAGEPLTPETVARMPRAHPRCGTNLMAAMAIFVVIADGIGTQTAIMIALILVFVGWRAIGYYMQQYITTKPPSPRHIQSGIKAGEELLAKYRREPNKTLDGFARLWNIGILQVGFGFIMVSLLIEALATALRIPWLSFFS